MKGKVLGVVSAVLFVIATLVSSTASYWFFYQPRVPKALQK
ncbi:MAG TPA: cyclic lactone autoinducer peptide [Acetivibrio sp.]|nr:cyclic lactone autoinducer peptide [Clostridium sp.]HOQ38498.1 cyclic lactone autoinducer peptide [Acetivibrio sp.]HPT90596.1 cyclic lactone autoinducer peptide [Acetivibrio sp.]HQA57030.1 cyclic lactone autoinducer peptide [Acetivibrio sp.]